MQNKVVQFNNIGDVVFSRNRQSKRIKICVKPDKSVRVSYPYYCSAQEVAEFLAKNEGWVLEQQQKIKQKSIAIRDGMQITTKLHKVVFCSSDTDRVTKNKNQVTVHFSNPELTTNEDVLSEVLNDLYRFEAKALLPKRLKDLAQTHGFQYNKVTIRNNRRNWGSCSSRNNISLNLQLMKMPDRLIDYVLLHELVHTEIKNHGPEFWTRLDSITNFQARQLAREVKKYSTYPI